MTKKKITIIFSIITALIILCSVYYYNLIEQNAVLSVKEDDLAKKACGLSFTALVSSAEKKFNSLYPTYLKKPYLNEDSNSSINEEYKIRKIELSLTEIKSFPARVDIEYDYTKTTILNGKSETDLNNGQNVFFLLKQKTKKNGAEWKNAALSLWIIPLVYISALLIISIVYNFIIVPGFSKKKTVENAAT